MPIPGTKNSKAQTATIFMDKMVTDKSFKMTGEIFIATSHGTFWKHGPQQKSKNQKSKNEKSKNAKP